MIILSLRVEEQEANGVEAVVLEVLELLLDFLFRLEHLIQSQLELELRQFKRVVTATQAAKVLILSFLQ